MNKCCRYAAGKPCWLEIANDDVAAVRSFFRELLGWDFDHGGTIVESAEGIPFGQSTIVPEPFGVRFAVIERGGPRP